MYGALYHTFDWLKLYGIYKYKHQENVFSCCTVQYLPDSKVLGNLGAKILPPGEEMGGRISQYF